MWAEEGEEDTQRQTEHEDRRDTLGEGPAVGGRVATAWGQLVICWSTMENFVPNEITRRMPMDTPLCLSSDCCNTVPQTRWLITDTYL